MTAPRLSSTSPDAERRAALALAMAPGVGLATYHDLVARFGSALPAFDATVRGTARAELLADAESALVSAECSGAAVLVAGSEGYPASLLDLGDAPPILFALGDLATIAAPVVAIVGTRDATPYGERVARDLAGALARAGACVVSGMARGIDGVAHRSALAACGRTAAVLGTGIDVAYPAPHRALQDQIARNGLLLAESLPGARATPGSFPMRNRIIAALAGSTIVVEAGVRSGALITAAYAVELGRTVAAVPGPIDSARSAGSNELLRDGAVVIASIDDALALAGFAPAPVAPVRLPDGEDARAIWGALASGFSTPDLLSLRTGLPAQRCLAAITELELAGAIDCAIPGEIRRR
ncbi:MAG: DNA-processing protein DprA [Gemmatimonadaceae bacterium]